MRALLVAFGIAAAAFGGVLFYRAVAYVRPPVVLVSMRDGTAERAPDARDLSVGLGLLVAGAGVAFFAARGRGGAGPRA
jgi:hypothetical protein